MKTFKWKAACAALILTSVGVSQAAEDSYRFSGALDFGYYKDFDKATKTGSISRSNVAFDALKNLGGGLAGTVKLNSRFFLRNPHTKEHLVNEDGKYLFAGEATAGLKGDFGHVRVGRALTALWQNDWVYDAWYNYDSIASPAWWTWHGNSPADPNASQKNASFARLNNGIFYASPQYAGFSADVSLGLKKQDADKNKSMSLALKYAQGNLNAMFATEKTPAGNQINFLGAQYTMGILSVMGAYDHEKMVDGGKNRSATISAKLVDGQFSYMIGGGRQLDYHSNFLGLGASYAYKPNTQVFVSYGNQESGFWGSNTSKDAMGIGVNYSF
jgi:predicted porin